MSAVTVRAMSMSFRREMTDRTWVASQIEGASPVDAGALALHAALAAAPGSIQEALEGALERGGGVGAEIASCVAALRSGGDLRAECLRLAGVLSRALG